MHIVDLEGARRLGGLRLVLIREIPSPWSEAARMVFDAKQVTYTAVPHRIGDEALRAWTGAHNAPVAVYDDRPPLTHWADILELAEEIAPEPALCPESMGQRSIQFALSHQVLGCRGLVWHSRLLLIDCSLKSGGERGFPLGLARLLAGKYGYQLGTSESSRAQIGQIFGLLLSHLEASRREYTRFFFGGEISALDIHVATALSPFYPPGSERFVTSDVARSWFGSAKEQVNVVVPPLLLEHRERVFERVDQLSRNRRET